jgi:hypothetical protein
VGLICQNHKSHPLKYIFVLVSNDTTRLGMMKLWGDYKSQATSLELRNNNPNNPNLLTSDSDTLR